MATKHVIGIDPGLSGAIAILNMDGEIHSIIDTPVLTLPKGKKKKNIYDLKAIHDHICTWEDVIVFEEEMKTMPPGFRPQASFSLGYCQGVFVGMFVAKAIRYELIHSKKWKKEFAISGAKGDQKVQSYVIGCQLFPSADLTGPRGGKKDGRSDALLIAEYGRRQLVRGKDYA